VGSEDDEDVVDGARADSLEHRLEQDALLDVAEPRRRPGSEDDGC